MMKKINALSRPEMRLRSYPRRRRVCLALFRMLVCVAPLRSYSAHSTRCLLIVGIVATHKVAGPALGGFAKDRVVLPRG
jgi:hypothetical protein